MDTEDVISNFIAESEPFRLGIHGLLEKYGIKKGISLSMRFGSIWFNINTDEIKQSILDKMSVSE